MDNYIVKLHDIVGDRAVSVAQGEEVKKILVDKLNEIKDLQLNSQVVVDFSGINNLLTVFMNTAIGDLYDLFVAEFLKDHLSVKNVPTGYRNTLKRVVDRAKQFYSEPKEFAQEIFEVTKE